MTSGRLDWVKGVAERHQVLVAHRARYDRRAQTLFSRINGRASVPF